ncbi:IS5 family transposase [Pseudorhodoferax sp. Leaf267]|uniref:IS5 family transposase n=1 Tax=Pseudorhodoferax sp. Leaf267 TaxID=1736316 RepID=UPI0007005C9D|nr:IS5 family transposase [Pseudorhodoferax sp. Leaf267]KQP13043.1 transposase [Pseudorhodoferax sp. Leaf267]
MSEADFFRQPLAEMIDPRHPLAVLAGRLPWAQIEAALAPYFARQVREGRAVAQDDLFGPSLQVAGAGVAAADRPRLPLRLMASLLYLKHAYKLSDEELVERWAENVVWQYFSGMAFYEPRLPCDATQIGRFRSAIGEAGVEELLKATIDTAVASKAIRPAEFERLIVDTTVQEKAIAHPVDSRLLQIARHKVVAAAKRAGIALKQTFVKEGKTLRRKAGGYAHAKQFKRLRKVVKRQRTILGIVLREVQRKIAQASEATALTLTNLQTLMQRAERIRSQRPKDKNKLYALHAPEVECIGKGKARKPYEFGVKVSVAVTHKQGLMVGARSFTGNPYDGHTLNEQLEQATILTEDTGAKPKQVVVDLGFRGVDAANPGVEIIHRGRFLSLTDQQRRWLRRRQAVEPAIGHLKHDNAMDRCWLHGASGDALHAVLCAAGYNIRWLLRAIVRLGLKGLFAPLLALLATLATALAAAVGVGNAGAHRTAWSAG